MGGTASDIAKERAQRRTQFLSAALEHMHELTVAELFAALTPEGIGQRLGYSASSVRYQFGRLFSTDHPSPDGASSKWTFDREQLAEAMLEEVHARIIATTLEVREVYLAALAEAVRTGSPAALVEAVTNDLDAWTPGASAAPTTVGERTYLLALSTVDTSAEMARRLRAIRAEEVELWSAFHARALEATGRRLRPHVSLAQLAGAIAQLAEGASMVRRYERSTPAADRTTARAMLAVFTGLTDDDPAARDAPLRSLVSDARTSRT